MREPSFKELEEQLGQGDRRSWSYATNMHPNPKFYKYYWWIFWRGSPIDGWAFLGKEYRLSTAVADQLMKKLRDEEEPYWRYNSRLPRRDPENTPFDPQSPRWEGVEWALAFDQDSDPIVELGGRTYK